MGANVNFRRLSTFAKKVHSPAEGVRLEYLSVLATITRALRGPC